MKTDTPDYEIESTVRPTDSIVMTVDMESLPEMFDVFSGLYADQELAILRELSTNARDSHIEAGVTRPIEVTLPNTVEPNLVIEDFGIGMSKTEIEETYSKYGASTKRNSNDFNGTLGLGSKSPLAYTPQFTFIGVKDGVKTMVSVAKTEVETPDGDVKIIPVMKVLSERETTDGNGVKVIVPVRSYNNFAEKAEHLFRFWDRETVLINGVKPTPISGMGVTDNIMVTTETDGQSYVIMAGVPYPTYFSHGLLQGHALVAHVPTGTVSFTPSREALKDNRKNREAIAAILAEYEREVPNAVQAQIEEAGNAREAFLALHQWRAALGTRTLAKTEYKFKNRVIPVAFEAPKGEKFTVTEPNSAKLSKVSREQSLPMETVVNALCVYGYDLVFTASHKKKLNKYVKDNNIKGVVHFVLSDKKLPTHWVDKSRMVDWETIRAIKLPRTGGQVSDPNRIKGSYDICEQGTWMEGVPGEDLDTTSPIYYIDVTHNDYEDSAAALLKQYKRGFTLVKLTSNRVAKFTRMFPNAEPVDKELRRICKRLERKVTDEERRAYSAQDDYFLKCAIKRVDASRLDDPAFAEIAGLLKVDLSKSALHKVKRFPGFARSKVGAKHKFANPLENYPLVSESNFRYGSSEDLDEIYMYMNASYANRVAKEQAKSEEEDK